MYIWRNVARCSMASLHATLHIFWLFWSFLVVCLSDIVWVVALFVDRSLRKKKILIFFGCFGVFGWFLSDFFLVVVLFVDRSRRRVFLIFLVVFGCWRVILILFGRWRVFFWVFFLGFFLVVEEFSWHCLAVEELLKSFPDIFWLFWSFLVVC